MYKKIQKTKRASDKEKKRKIICERDLRQIFTKDQNKRRQEFLICHVGL
jgi:hypothetical protein